MRMRQGDRQLPKSAALPPNAKWVLGIPANQYGVGRPPFNLGGIQINLGGGVLLITTKALVRRRGSGQRLWPDAQSLHVRFLVNLGAILAGVTSSTHRTLISTC